MNFNQARKDLLSSLPTTKMTWRMSFILLILIIILLFLWFLVYQWVHHVLPLFYS